MVGVSNEVRMGDYASVYMLPDMPGKQFHSFRKALLMAAEEVLEEYKGQSGVYDFDVDEVNRLAEIATWAENLDSLNGIGGGTLVLVNNMWFTRSSRAACCDHIDLSAIVVKRALRLCDIERVLITKIQY